MRVDEQQLGFVAPEHLLGAVRDDQWHVLRRALGLRMLEHVVALGREADALRGRQQTKTSGTAASAALPAGIVVALIAGTVLLFSGLFGDSGPFLFIIGVALLVYAVRRLLRFRRGVPGRAREQAMQRIASLIDAARKR